MNNITPIRQSPFNSESRLYFKVCERPDGWQDKHGTWHADPNQKKLLRQDPVTDEPIILATVGNKYQTVQNRELFEGIERAMIDTVPSQYLDGVTRSESLSYGGAVGLHDYLFPAMRVAFNEAVLRFRIVARNGYGLSAVNVLAGAFDGYCMNGCVTGVADQHYRRHTSGLKITGIEDVIKRAIDNFWIEAAQFKAWADVPLSHSRALECLENIPGISKRLQGKPRQRLPTAYHWQGPCRCYPHATSRASSQVGTLPRLQGISCLTRSTP